MHELFYRYQVNLKCMYEKHRMLTLYYSACQVKRWPLLVTVFVKSYYSYCNVKEKLSGKYLMFLIMGFADWLFLLNLNARISGASMASDTVWFRSNWDSIRFSYLTLCFCERWSKWCRNVFGNSFLLLGLIRRIWIPFSCVCAYGLVV